MTEYEKLKAELEDTGIQFAEDGWTQMPTPPYGVYTLEGQAAALIGDDDTKDMAMSGSVDLFTLSDVPALCHIIRQALRRSGVSWQENSRQYEDDTRLHHIEWTFEVFMHPEDDEPEE